MSGIHLPESVTTKDIILFGGITLGSLALIGYLFSKDSDEDDSAENTDSASSFFRSISKQSNTKSKKDSKKNASKRSGQSGALDFGSALSPPPSSSSSSSANASSHSHSHSKAKSKSSSSASQPSEDIQLRNLIQQAEVFKQEKRYLDSERIYREIMDIMVSKRGEEHVLMGYCHESLADLLSKQNKNSDAELQFKKAIMVWEKNDMEEQMLDTKLSLAQLLEKTPARVDEAAAILIHCLDRGVPKSLEASFRIELGNVRTLQNDFTGAEEIYSKILYSKLITPEDPNVLFLNLSLAGVKLYQGFAEEGNKMYQELSKISFPGVEDMDVIHMYIFDQAARINWEIGRYEESESYFNKYNDIFKNHPERDTSRFYNDLANFRWHLNQPEKAEALWDSMRMLEKPPLTTSKTLITSSCRVITAVNGTSHYELKLRLRIRRAQGVRFQWIIPTNGILEIKFENLEGEDKPPVETVFEITEEMRNTTNGEFTVRSKDFSKIEKQSNKANFDVAIRIFSDSTKTEKLGEHHQLVGFSTN